MTVKSKAEEAFEAFLESRVFVGEPTHETCFLSGFAAGVKAAAGAARDYLSGTEAADAIRELSEDPS